MTVLEELGGVPIFIHTGKYKGEMGFILEKNEEGNVVKNFKVATGTKLITVSPDEAVFCPYTVVGVSKDGIISRTSANQTNHTTKLLLATRKL